MTDQITLKLSRIDFNQIVDGLAMRCRTWRQTADQLEAGVNKENEDWEVVHDGSNADQARQIADHYDDIIKEIEKQAGKLTRIADPGESSREFQGGE